MSNQPNSSAEQSQAIYSQYQTATQQLQLIESQLNQIGAVVDELNHNIVTLNGLKSKDSSKEVILPLGGLLFIKAKLTGKDETLLNVGSDTVIPTTFDNGISILTSRLNEMNEAYRKLAEDRMKLAEIASQLENQLNQISRQRQ
ncbi:MAG: prefoldin subunit alpha [Candidatus Heimdallarchaeota archaeon]|nr:prefoldin subunit alpha [Candidatus Heimdallarchaeota archaeon]